MNAPDLLARVRDDIECERAHFNHAGMSLTPAPASGRVLRHLALEGRIGGYEAEEAVADELAAVPVAIAALLGATAAEVTVTESATAAWEWALWSMAETLGWRDGDRILCDQFSYGTMYASMQRLRLAHGVDVVEVGAERDGTIDTEELGHQLDDGAVLAMVTHMPTHEGTLTDAEAVGRIIRDSDAIYALDIAQTLGQMPVDVGAIGCDVAFGPARKFLRAPRGTAVLYIRSELADRLVPLTPSFGTDYDESLGRFPLAGGVRRFDQFEFNVAARLGLGVAARYASEIGLDLIAEQVEARSREVVEIVSSFDTEIAGGSASRGIVSFVHRSHEAHAVRERLATAGVSVWVNTAAGTPRDARARPRLLPSVRVSPHYVTNDDDLARLHAAMRSL